MNKTRPSYKDIVSYAVIAWYNRKIEGILANIMLYIHNSTFELGMQALPFCLTDTDFRFNLYYMIRELRRLNVDFVNYCNACKIKTSLDCDISFVLPVTDADVRANSEAFINLICEYSHEVALQITLANYLNKRVDI